MLADKPAKIRAAYLSPSRPLTGADLTACFSGGLPVLLAGDLNAKNVGWNSRLSTRRGKILHDCSDENSCLIFGPDTPITNRYNPSATSDVLDIVITKKFPSPVLLTSCSAMSSDHLPVLIDTAYRSSFQHPPVALISEALIASTSKLTWKTKFRSIWNCTTRRQTICALRTSPAPFWRFWQLPLSSVAGVTTRGLRWHLAFMMRYAWRTGCQESGRSPGTERLSQSGLKTQKVIQPKFNPRN
jgi:hypothetical protein